MANYVVGDIQGCYAGLLKLLKKAKFDPQKDKLWAVGDLIARGPDSLQTLLFLRSLGDAFDCVLGNHDLHFLAIYSGLKHSKKGDLLDALINSDEVDSLVQWLRFKPLALRINKHNLICHAGLYPNWSFKQAIKLSAEVCTELQGPNWQAMLQAMYGNEPRQWEDSLVGHERLRFIINAFTRMRFITGNRALEFDTKTSPKYASKSLRPWFSIENQALKKKHKVIFGHWATLMGNTQSKAFVGLDTGYVWGNQMTLYCIESEKKIQIEH